MSQSSVDKPLWGCVELGGTTIKVATAEGDDVTNVIEQKSFESGAEPEKVMQEVMKFFNDKRITAYGIGSFGPVDLNPKSPTYGYITSTPKPGWQDFNVLRYFPSNSSVTVGFNTDVNTAALGELLHGGHGDVQSVVYVTVGTGIGAGLVLDGHIVTGILHPEAGHIPVKRHEKDLAFKGACPFHQDCLEGLTSARSVAARLGVEMDDLKKLPDDHEVWDISAYYLAQLCCNLAMIVSPHVIVLGGGLLKRTILFPKIREHFKKLVNGYLRVPKMLTDAYIVPSKFEAAGSKTSAGCVGTLAYAKHIYDQKQHPLEKK